MISQFSCVFLCNTSMTNSDKHNIFFAHAPLQTSVRKTLNTKRNITQTSKATNWWSFDESFARCLGNIIKLYKIQFVQYFLRKDKKIL